MVMMKKFLFILVALIATFQLSAQTTVKVYKGNSSSYGDVICNISGDKVYIGNSSSYGDVILNINSGKIYKGNSSSYGDVIANIDGGKVRSGNSSSYGDTKFNIDGMLTKEEFIAVWLAVNYIF